MRKKTTGRKSSDTVPLVIEPDIANYLMKPITYTLRVLIEFILWQKDISGVKDIKRFYEKWHRVVFIEGHQKPVTGSVRPFK